MIIYLTISQRQRDPTWFEITFLERCYYEFSFFNTYSIVYIFYMLSCVNSFSNLFFKTNFPMLSKLSLWTLCYYINPFIVFGVCIDVSFLFSLLVIFVFPYFFLICLAELDQFYQSFFKSQINVYFLFFCPICILLISAVISTISFLLFTLVWFIFSFLFFFNLSMLVKRLNVS